MFYFLLKYLIIIDFFCNSFIIYSITFNGGSSKRKIGKNGNGASTTNNVAIQTLLNSSYIDDNSKVEIKDMLQNQTQFRDMDDHQVDAIKDSNKNIEKRVDDTMKFVNSNIKTLNDILNDVKNFNYRCDDIIKIHEQIKSIINIINSSIDNCTSEVLKPYGIKDKKLQKKMETIKLAIEEKFKAVKENVAKKISVISKGIELPVKFLQALEGVKNIYDPTKKIIDNKNSVTNFLSEKAEYFSNLYKIRKCDGFAGSTFCQSLKDTIEKIETNYEEFVQEYINEFKAESVTISNNLSTIDKDFNTEKNNFSNKMCDLEDNADGNTIKNKFKTIDITLDDFCKNIAEFKNTIETKINSNKAEISNISNRFSVIKEIGKKIININKKAKKSYIISGLIKKETDIVEENRKRLTDQQKFIKRVKEQEEKYNELLKAKKKLISEYNEKAKQIKFQLDLEKVKEIAPEEKKEQFKKFMALYSKHEEMLNSNKFILSFGEYKVFEETFNKTKENLKIFLNNSIKTLKSQDKLISDLKDEDKKNEDEIKILVDSYNKKVEEISLSRAKYLSDIKTSNSEIIKLVRDLEKDENNKEQIILNLTEKYHEKFDENLKFMPKNVFQKDSYLGKLINSLDANLKENNPKYQKKMELKQNLEKKINHFKLDILKYKDEHKKNKDALDELCKKIEEYNNKIDDYGKRKKAIEDKIDSLKFLTDVNVLKKLNDGDVEKERENFIEKHKKSFDGINNLNLYKKDSYKNEQKKCDYDLIDENPNLKIENYEVNECNPIIIERELSNNDNCLSQNYIASFSAKLISKDELEDEKKLEQNIKFRALKLLESLKQFIKDYGCFYYLFKDKATNDVLCLSNSTIFSKIKSRHQKYISDGFINFYTLYFLEYFSCKNDYAKICDEIDDIQDLLVQYDALLTVKDVSAKDDKIKNLIDTVNSYLGYNYEELFKYNLAKKICTDKKSKNLLSNIISLLSKGKFEENLKGLCKFYEGVSCKPNYVLNAIRYVEELKTFDESYYTVDKIGEVIKIFIKMSNLRALFDKFKKDNSLRNNVTTNTTRDNFFFGREGKINSDLKILDDYLAKISAEYILLDNTYEKFNEKEINFEVGCDPKDELNSIYYLVKCGKYFCKIIKDKDSVFNKIYEDLNKVLQKVYGEKMYKLLENFKKVFGNEGFLNELLKKTERQLEIILTEFEKVIDYEDKIKELVKNDKFIYDNDQLKEINEVIFKKLENVYSKNNSYFFVIGNIDSNINADDYKNNFNYISSIFDLKKELYVLLGILNYLSKGEINIIDIDKNIFAVEDLKFKDINVIREISKETVKEEVIENGKKAEVEKEIEEGYIYKIKESDDNKILTEVFKSMNGNLKLLYNDIKKLKLVKQITEDNRKNEFLSNLNDIRGKNLNNYKLPADQKDFFEIFEDVKKGEFINISSIGKDVKGNLKKNKYNLIKGFKALEPYITNKAKIGDKDFYFFYELRKQIANKFNGIFKLIDKQILSNKDLFKYDDKIVEGSLDNLIENDDDDFKNSIKFICNHVKFFNSYYKFFTELKSFLKKIGLEKNSGIDLSFFNKIKKNYTKLENFSKVGNKFFRPEEDKDKTYLKFTNELFDKILDKIVDEIKEEYKDNLDDFNKDCFEVFINENLIEGKYTKNEFLKDFKKSDGSRVEKYEDQYQLLLLLLKDKITKGVNVEKYQSIKGKIDAVIKEDTYKGFDWTVFGAKFDIIKELKNSLTIKLEVKGLKFKYCDHDISDIITLLYDIWNYKEYKETLKPEKKRFDDKKELINKIKEYCTSSKSKKEIENFLKNIKECYKLILFLFVIDFQFNDYEKNNYTTLYLQLNNNFDFFEKIKSNKIISFKNRCERNLLFLFSIYLNSKYNSDDPDTVLFCSLPKTIQTACRNKNRGMFDKFDYFYESVFKQDKNFKFFDFINSFDVTINGKLIDKFNVQTEVNAVFDEIRKQNDDIYYITDIDKLEDQIKKEEEAKKEPGGEPGKEDGKVAKKEDGKIFINPKEMEDYKKAKENMTEAFNLIQIIPTI